jgi:hypothetical protein
MMWLVEDHSVIFEMLLCRRYTRFQVLVQRMLILAVDIDDPEEGKFWHEIITRSNIFQAIEQFRFGFGGLLVAELIARDGEDSELVTTGEFFLQCIQLKILKCYASERSDVHDQAQLVSVLGQGLLLQIEILEFKVVDRASVLTCSTAREWQTAAFICDYRREKRRGAQWRSAAMVYSISCQV